ncbi:MAG: DNA mismatch repair endonuclease MutL [Acidobacteriota bacterium]|nr:DNA mismatch repair endonuclease MutL [Acidobacteriota bacterium]
MGKIRVLSDNLANQIAAGEVVERPASVAKELLENSLDAGATRIAIEIEAGGRRLLKITDDGEGMTRDDAVLAFERHATSKIRTFEDLNQISTLGFRGEALASIASVARVELTTKTAGETAATKVQIEGGRLIDVKDAAHPQGTTVCVRDLFFNVPARRKFMRSEATENFHLINLVTHYALAHPDKAFVLNNNGREAMRVTPARNLRERAYQVFGADFLDSLMPVSGGSEFISRISGFISAPRERRTNRDAQYFFVNGRYVRDKIMARALSEGYRSVLPHGVYPVALLFVEIPAEEVDVNVHPAKTEVRFRRPEAIREVITEEIRKALANSGFLQQREIANQNVSSDVFASANPIENYFENTAVNLPQQCENQAPQQNRIEFAPEVAESAVPPVIQPEIPAFSSDFEKQAQSVSDFGFHVSDLETPPVFEKNFEFAPENKIEENRSESINSNFERRLNAPKSEIEIPFDSAAKLPRAVEVENLSPSGIRPLGQMRESFIIATDSEGLLLIDQHVAHERILFDKYRKKMGERRIESQNLLLPETFDLTPAQAVAFELVQNELEELGFGLMRLSGRTIAIKSVPSDLPAGEARNLLREILETIDSEKRGGARETWRDEIAASLACRAAVKINMPLTQEKMQWMIDKLLTTSSPTTCPHGRPVILRLTMRDIERAFHRP